MAGYSRYTRSVAVFVMRYLTLFVTAFVLLSANDWKLVLKNGKTIACEGVPIIVNDVYMFRDSEGKDATLPADQVDRAETDRINKVAAAPQQWRRIGESVRQLAPEGVSAWSDADFDAEVVQSSTPVLVDFCATWCGYCKKIAPTVDEVANEFAGKLKVGKVDIDKSPATARRYGIHFTPTLLLFEKGQVVATIEGAAGKSAIVHMLQSHL
jgi:thioredoxin 1